jgi:hypothetical protein
MIVITVNRVMFGQSPSAMTQRVNIVLIDQLHRETYEHSNKP